MLLKSKVSVSTRKKMSARAIFFLALYTCLLQSLFCHKSSIELTLEKSTQVCITCTSQGHFNITVILSNKARHKLCLKSKKKILLPFYPFLQYFAIKNRHDVCEGISSIYNQGYQMFVHFFFVTFESTQLGSLE